MTTTGAGEADEAPSAVVAAAGTWLGDALQGSGFHWMPGPRRLERRVGTLRHQVHVQPNRHNRRGMLVKIGTMLNVREPALARWRRAHPDRVTSFTDFVCGHLLGYASGRANGYLYGDAQDGDIDLTDPAQRDARLQRFVSMFREAVLPWFDEASDPELIVTSRAADCTNDPVSVVEWLASRHRPDLIDAYVQRYVARHGGADQCYDDGVQAGQAGQPNLGRLMVNTATALGWSVAALTRP